MNRALSVSMRHVSLLDLLRTRRTAERTHAHWFDRTGVLNPYSSTTLSALAHKRASVGYQHIDNARAGNYVGRCQLVHGVSIAVPHSRAHHYLAFIGIPVRARWDGEDQLSASCATQTNPTRQGR